MRIEKNVCASLTAALLASLVAGCHDEPAPQAPLQPQPLPPPTMTAPPPPPPPTATATATPPAPATGPCDASMQLALQTALKAREKTELGHGMKAEAGFSCMNVTEGGAATVPLMLEAGKCYSFLAQSFPNVSEVDITLKPNFGNPVPPLLAMFANQPIAVDSDTGPAATVGKGAQCFKNPFPIPGLVIVEAKARVGAGPVAVQVYSK